MKKLGGAILGVLIIAGMYYSIPDQNLDFTGEYAFDEPVSFDTLSVKRGNSKKDSITTSYDFSCKSEEKKSDSLKDYSVPKKVYFVNNSKDTVIRHQTGSTISIPQNCFETAEGKEVEGFVSLSYREFHTGLDIALSGIPMNLGDTAQLVSGGMFEITAEKQGTELKVKEGKEIKVRLVTGEKRKEFDHYFLNTDNRWERKGDLEVDTSDAVRAIAENTRWWEYTEDWIGKKGFFQEKKRGVVLAVRQSEIKKLRKWAKRRKGLSDASFYTVFSKRSFPENRNLKYLSWRLMPENDPEVITQFMAMHDEKRESAHSMWSNMTVSQCENNEFYVHFSRENKDLVLRVKPDAKRYPGENRFLRKQLKLEKVLTVRANNQIQGLFDEALPLIETDITGLNENELKRYVVNHGIYKSEVEKWIRLANFKLPNKQKPFMSEFSVVEMGVHNIDAPASGAAALAVGLFKAPLYGVQETYNLLAKASYKRYKNKMCEGIPVIEGENGSLENIAKVVLMYKGVSTTNTFVGKQLQSDFKFNKRETIVGLVFLLNGDIKVIRPKSFKKQKPKNAFFPFDAELCTSLEEVKEILGREGFQI